MEFFETFGWREAVIGMAALVGIYAGIIIIRLSRVSRPKQDAEPAWKQDAKPAWKQDPAEFGEQVFRSGVEAELKDLREQVVALKEEVDKLKAARTVSPQYGEAVTLAQQGLDAQIIAVRCGISVSEAEMVRALSRRQEQ
jgi:hypothetical protein